MKVRTDLRAGKKGKSVRTKPEDRPHVEDAPNHG